MSFRLIIKLIISYVKNQRNFSFTVYEYVKFVEVLAEVNLGAG